MRLGIVGWCTDAGLGREFRDALKSLPVECAFVLPNVCKPTRHELLEGVPHMHASKGMPVSEMVEFIDKFKPDTLLMWELPGSWQYPGIWRARGVKWACVIHWDWFTMNSNCWDSADLLISPTMECHRQMAAHGYKTKFLPVPVDTEEFAFRMRHRARRFLSVGGFGGAGDRRGLKELFHAWKFLGSDAPVLEVTAQQALREMRLSVPRNVEIRVTNISMPAALYSTADVCIQTSRYEGIGLPLMEAQACGLPVITTDAEPMRTLAPDLLVDVKYTEEIDLFCKKMKSSVCRWESIVERVHEVMGTDISDLSCQARERMTAEFSWGALGAEWYDALNSL